MTCQLLGARALADLLLSEAWTGKTDRKNLSEKKSKTRKKIAKPS